MTTPTCGGKQATMADESMSSDFFDGDVSAVFSNAGGDNDDAVGTRKLETEERKTLARKESNAVVCWRFVVYFVVLVVAISVSLAVYSYTKSDQEEDFETRFEAYAAKVAESFYDSVERKLGAIQTLSTSITSHAGTCCLAEIVSIPLSFFY